MKKIWAVISATGGSGKSLVSNCLAEALAQAEPSKKTLVIDGSFGFRAMDLYFGVESLIVFDGLDVLEENANLQEALVLHPVLKNLFLLPAGNERLKEKSLPQLTNYLKELKKQFEYIIIDFPQGITPLLEWLVNENIVESFYLVSTLDRISLRGSEKVIQWLFEKNQKRPQLILNKAVPKLLKEKRISPENVALQLDIDLLGTILYDEEIATAFIENQEGFQLKGKTLVSLQNTFKRIQGEEIPFEKDYDYIYSFLQRWF